MAQDLSDLRREYIARGLHEEEIDANPVLQFRTWFTEVLSLEIDLPNAMVIATADAGGIPDARYVLLKEYSDEGFVFYTSSLSRKGQQLKERPWATLVFFWKELDRQVRISGRVEVLPADAADNYFRSRPRGSQIGAWVAPQSEVIPDQKYMSDRSEELAHQYDGQDVPRPQAWLGYRVIPDSYEFWQGQENRLHDRIQYLLNEGGTWTTNRLAP